MSVGVASASAVVACETASTRTCGYEGIHIIGAERQCAGSVWAPLKTDNSRMPSAVDAGENKTKKVIVLAKAHISQIGSSVGLLKSHNRTLPPLSITSMVPFQSAKSFRVANA